MQKSWSENKTFWIAFILTILFVFWGVFGIESLRVAADVSFNFITQQLGWSFMLGGTIFVLVAMYIMLSKIGDIKLGEPDEEPKYTRFEWFSMLFSAGMGIGLVFWSVSEPIWHYIWPATGAAANATAETQQAAINAMRLSFFHWGIHPWSIYIIVGGSLAYFSYHKGLPMLLSSTLEPIIGEDNLDTGWGRLINIIGVYATLFGLATSLGLGAMSIVAGLAQLNWIASASTGAQIVVVIVVTAAAVVSTITGIDKGIRYLSKVNVWIMSILMIFVVLIGPTLFILRLFTNSMGQYLQHIVEMSFMSDAIMDNAWLPAWTIFYWAWWIAWAPFVGTFIARVSKGRTIREFVIGSLFVPVLVSLIWFAVFGGTGLHVALGEGGQGLIEAVQESEAAGFYAALATLPLSKFLIFLGTLSVTLFFITSSDSATYVNGMLTSGGNPNPPRPLRVFWGISEGAIAAILIFTGGLSALQTASVVSGFPFMVIMFFMIYCLLKDLHLERKKKAKGVGKYSDVEEEPELA
ncbi:MAG TPA: BCCT family transporter [Halanaerobiales bacterium]|nr:BCCT family transporter [Halanaerobiales bacterium]